MTLDEYVAGASGGGAGGERGALLEDGLRLVGAVGEVAGVLAGWLLGGERRRDPMADALADVAYGWAQLCAVTGVAPGVLLARSRAHVEWRRAGRPAGGPAIQPSAMTLDDFAAWAAGAVGAASADPPDDLALADVGLALSADAGEVVECVRKMARDGGGERERLAGELGDVWRYWSWLCAASGTTPAEVLTRSRARVEGAST